MTIFMFLLTQNQKNSVNNPAGDRFSEPALYSFLNFIQN